MKLTPWYPPEVKPVRVGWYDCEVCTENRHLWDGWCWKSSKYSHGQLTVGFRWRGLAEPPNGKK